MAPQVGWATKPRAPQPPGNTTWDIPTNVPYSRFKEPSVNQKQMILAPGEFFSILDGWWCFGVFKDFWPHGNSVRSAFCWAKKRLFGPSVRMLPATLRTLNGLFCVLAKKKSRCLDPEMCENTNPAAGGPKMGRFATGRRYDHFDPFWPGPRYRPATLAIGVLTKIERAFN